MNTITETETTTAPAETELTMPELTVVETERDVFAKNRETIAKALRANGDKQITGAVFGNGGFCFVGCASKALDGVD